MWTACVCFFFIWKIADSYNPRQKTPFLQRTKNVQKHKREKSWGIQEKKKKDFRESLCYLQSKTAVSVNDYLIVDMNLAWW